MAREENQKSPSWGPKERVEAPAHAEKYLRPSKATPQVAIHGQGLRVIHPIENLSHHRLDPYYLGPAEDRSLQPRGILASMNYSSQVLSSAFFLLFTPILASQDVVPEVIPAGSQGSSQASITVEDDGSPSVFGEPLIVNGKRIPDLELMRYLCYGKGRGGLESRKMEVLLSQEMELRAFMRTQEILDENYDSKDLSELSEEDRATVNGLVDEALAIFRYDPKELEERLIREEKQFYERYPSLDLRTEIERSYQDWDWYLDQVGQTIRFDTIFFPGTTEDWPDITIEAVHAGSPAFDLVEDYQEAYDMRKAIWEDARTMTENRLLQEQYDGRLRDALTDDERAAADALVNKEHGSFMPREDEMMMSLLRDFVISTLSDPNVVTILGKLDGLPADTLITVSGGGLETTIKTADVYEEFKGAFSAQDIFEAKKFLALYVAVSDVLEDSGQLVPWDDFLNLLLETRVSLQGSMFNLDFLALQGHNFPSMEVYNDYLYLVESFRRSITHKTQLDGNSNLSKEMQAYIPVGNGIMGLAKVQAEALMVSAFDYPNNKWKEDGWQGAEEEAFRLRAMADAHIDELIAEEELRRMALEKGVDFEGKVQPFDQWWAQLLDLHSDYWDAPMPATGKMPAMVGMRNKGRFNGEAQTRNDLKRALNESTWSHYLSGDNVVDQVFFELEEGQVGGPYRGAKGYYLVYNVRKLRPMQPVNYRDERQLGLLQEDFVRREFARFAHETLANAEVSGL